MKITTLKPAQTPDQESKRFKGILAIASISVCMLGTIAYAQNERQLPTHPNAIQFQVAETKGEPMKPMAASFVEVGKPTGGYKCIVDMTEFNGKIFLSTADDPLGNWGAKVFNTTDGASYTQVLSDGTSQGYLRMGVYDSKLWIPDGDPNGYDPSFVYISSTGNSGSFTKTNVLGAVHTFDITKFMNKFYVANGMKSGLGGMCLYDGANSWNSVKEPGGSFRLKYMAQINGKLFVADANTNSSTDYFLWSGDIATTSPQSMDKVPGGGSTYQIYTSSQNKMFWTVVHSGAIHVLTSTDGTNWTPSASLDGKFVSDFAEINGKLYALEWKGGLWESSDHNTFTAIAAPPANAVDAFGPLAVQGGYNADARASMVAYNGSLYCGSSTNGKVYRVDIATSVQENAQNLKFRNVFPNPATDRATIVTSNEVNNATLTIHDQVGKVVRTIHNINGTNITIERGDLPGGMYYIQLNQEGLLVASDKLIIAE